MLLTADCSMDGGDKHRCVWLQGRTTVALEAYRRLTLPPTEAPELEVRRTSGGGRPGDATKLVYSLVEGRTRSNGGRSVR